MIAACKPTQQGDGERLSQAFTRPGSEAKPWVYWYWMNGNVTREGITADIRAMSEVGIGGAFLMCIGGPWERPGLDTAYNQLTPAWWGLVEHAFKEAEKEGIRLGMSACDGWATAGGPVIRPKDAMKKVVWSMMNLDGGKPVTVRTPLPPLNAGIYQEFGQEFTGERRFYRDIACYAIPEIGGITKKMPDYDFKVSTTIPGIDPAGLFDGNLKTTAINTRDKGYIQIAFAEPFTCRSIRLFSEPDRWFPYPYYAARMELLTSDDGLHFISKGRFTPDQHGWQDDGCPVTLRISETRARFYRFIFDMDTAFPVSMRYVGADRKYISLSEIELSPVPWIDHFEAKAGFRYRVAPPEDPGFRVNGSLSMRGMINVSEYLDSAGVLTWNAPAGSWTILRMGYTITGNENETGGGGIGLESDKFSRQATRLVFDHWLGETIRRIGIERAGKVLPLMHVDSWEAATQNWTDSLGTEFRNRRGYDPIPFLPALAGFPVESPEVYENFLYDYRLTIAEVLNDNFYGEMARLAHENGSEFSAEATAPVMVSDGMLHHKYADRPMGEFWRDDPAPYDKPEDILEAVSGAHVYNKPIVQAESFTDVDSKWYEYPFALKAEGDYNFCRGINKFFIHVFVQQPFVDKKPGLTLGQTGLHFNRGQVWWNQAKPWVGYLTTCQSMLQQGCQAADMLCFTGMDVPRRALLPDQLSVTVPAGYRYLSVNPDALLNEVTVENGFMKLPNGALHKVLVLSGDPFLGNGKYSPEVMRKIGELVQAGIIVVGPKPVGSAGLKDYRAHETEVRNLADLIWGNCNGHDTTVNRYGRGSVYWGEPLEKILAKEHITPDMTVSGADSIDFIHKCAGTSDFYFISNQRGVAQVAVCSFRIDGRVPEIWNPVTGERFLCEYRSERGRTIVGLELPPSGSLFVVFNRRPGHGLKKPAKKVKIDEVPIGGNWLITFGKNRGLPESFAIQTDTLFSLTTHPDPSVKHFSGTARYELVFNFTRRPADQSIRYTLDLGRVENVANVTLNGMDLGILWTKPVVTDITEAVREGTNRLVVEVTNTWNNRIVRDMQLSNNERIAYFPHFAEYPKANDSNGFLIRSVDYRLRDAGLIGPCLIRISRFGKAPQGR
jgi:hypothetical protein